MLGPERASIVQGVSLPCPAQTTGGRDAGSPPPPLRRGRPPRPAGIKAQPWRPLPPVMRADPLGLAAPPGLISGAQLMAASGGW